MTTDQLQTGLFASLGLTVVVLATAIFLAHKHKAKAHIAGICVFLVCFLVTLYFAETLGRRYTFDHISYPIHLSLAVFTALTVLAPLGTGFQHWRGKLARATHVKVSWAWGACVGLSLITGGWMLSHGTLKADVDAPAPPAAPR